MKTLDVIDTIAANLYDIDPIMLHSRSRRERVAYARFVAISLRFDGGVSVPDLAKMYGLNQETIRYAIRKTRELVSFNAPFRNKYSYAHRLYLSGCIPFAAELIANGSHVRTRTDSNGLVRCGIVTKLDNNLFTVESFNDPRYITVHDRITGRVSPEYESSLDIVQIDI